MAISFLRIDDRLIHGQMAASWIGSSPCDGIVVVDDDAAQNEVQKSLAVHSPFGKDVVFSIPEVSEKPPKVIESQNKYYVIVRNAIALSRLAEAVPAFRQAIRKVNVKSMSKREDAIPVNRGQSIIPEEIPAFEHLAQIGFSIKFRLVAGVTSGNFFRSGCQGRCYSHRNHWRGWDNQACKHITRQINAYGFQRQRVGLHLNQSH